MADRAQVAETVYGVLTTRWPDRINGVQLTDEVSLGGEGLGLDSIEIVELVLECEDRMGTPAADSEDLLRPGQVSIGSLIDHLATV